MSSVGGWACERCGQPLTEARALCERCSTETATADQPPPRRSSVPRVSVGCSCGTYAGVKVHALGCPEAPRREEERPHDVPEAAPR